MNKKQNNSAILAGIAITAILVASSLIAGNQFVQQAHASEDSVVKIKYRYHSETVTSFSQ